MHIQSNDDSWRSQNICCFFPVGEGVTGSASVTLYNNSVYNLGNTFYQLPLILAAFLHVA